MSGAWIGIDFGTTHSCAAVWDSTRGRPKVMRLASALPDPNNQSKLGRLVPTAMILVHSHFKNDAFLHSNTQLLAVDGFENLRAMIGAPAMHLWQRSISSHRTQQGTSASQVAAALVVNFKPDFSAAATISHQEQAMYDPSSGAAIQNCITVTPLGSDTPIQVDPTLLVQVYLSGIRKEAEAYLRQNARKKRLVVPWESSGPETSSVADLVVDHVVLGVPCSWDQSTRRRLEHVAVRAGFETAHILTEPTAACLSYGLGVASTKTVLIFDMGGGTTDVTIAELQASQHVVVVTHGASVGGNDLDAAILDWVLMSSTLQPKEGWSATQRQVVLQACKTGKEELCSNWSEISHVEIAFQSQTLLFNKDAFETVTQPILKRVQEVVKHALEKCQRKIDEVVLVGGSTRVPDIPALLTCLTGCSNLCSVHPLTAVARGTAIHAARISSCVPLHELQSALLLDALPYAIGVLSATDNEFVPVLSQYARIPAQGVVSFELADKWQTGVTVKVVELVEGDCFVEIQSFQFLLHRLKPRKLQQIDTRWIQLQMDFTELGQLVATVIDELDPEHQRRFLLRPDTSDAETLPVGLILTCAALAVLYVAVKVAFHEVEIKEL